MRQHARWRSLTAGQPSSAQTTHYVSRQWIERGTAISAPIAPLAADGVFAVLTAAMATRAIWRVTGSRVCSAGASLGEGAEMLVYASRGAVEDSGAQGGQGVQATADREHFLWRIDQFEQLGFSEAEASQLAESDADLGQARHLLATGCSLTLALQILL